MSEDATFFYPNRFMTVRVKILGHEPPIVATTDQFTASRDIRSLIDATYLQSLIPEGPSLLSNMVTPKPQCRFVYGTKSGGGEHVIGMLSRRLKISMWLEAKASSTLRNTDVNYPPGWLDMKVQNVLVVRDLPVPFHISLTGAQMMVNFAGGSEIQSSDFLPSYRNHIYWKSRPNVTVALGSTLNSIAQTTEIGNGVTGHATKSYADCSFCGHKKAKYICSRCHSEW